MVSLSDEQKQTATDALRRVSQLHEDIEKLIQHTRNDGDASAELIKAFNAAVAHSEINTGGCCSPSVWDAPDRDFIAALKVKVSSYHSSSDPPVTLSSLLMRSGQLKAFLEARLRVVKPNGNATGCLVPFVLLLASGTSFAVLLAIVIINVL